MRQKKASPLLAPDTLTVRPAVRKQLGCMFGGSTILSAEATAGPGEHENSAHGCISESMRCAVRTISPETCILVYTRSLTVSETDTHGEYLSETGRR
jgi:hypothetical protein